MKRQAAKGPVRGTPASGPVGVRCSTLEFAALKRQAAKGAKGPVRGTETRPGLGC